VIAAISNSIGASFAGHLASGLGADHQLLRAPLAAIRIFVPLALDGEAAVEHGSNGEAIAVVSVVSIVGGYLLLYALWRYVFSEKAKLKRGEPPDRSDRG
jgi:hypothetical protein